jgi:hypothetical protein
VWIPTEDWFYISVMNGNYLVLRNSPDRMPYYKDTVVKQQIGIYTQKQHRYVSLHAAKQKELLITRRLSVVGKQLQLNEQANPGLIRVILDSADPVATLNRTTISMAARFTPLEARPLQAFGDSFPL